MDSRITRIRSKLAKIPYQARRSHSMASERHQFRLGPCVSASEADVFEAEHRIVLPAAYRAFLTELGGSGAGPFYGLLPLDECRLFTMNRKPADGSPRGFTHGDHSDALQGDLFLHIIEMGCSDLCLIGVTGPLAGRVVTGNADGFWPPNVSSAQDFLSWYERWLDHMRDGKDNRALGLTSPIIVATASWGPRATASPRCRNPVHRPSRTP
ncbi:SMI1/KNR4 family protein [Streptomyces sp. R302]|uniref:SMI1/KNR4 family protein n=1 Tax=unclassified Streptomyces TaxID=2593676 RepID=UPI00145F8152|nr:MULTISPECIES: SMI1/KNR4 family protein [unclassified Streptomyces]NML50272.1 SMI1/KNR4 family protein [Streptomyces sp. R301]NML79263.1 SMI1/KNR4 family protein [Streptomyces sp. R302]